LAFTHLYTNFVHFKRCLNQEKNFDSVMKNFAILLFSALLILSCKKDNSGIPQFHYEYYPLEEGTYVVYEAMEIAHDIQALVARDTNRFYLKTVIGEPLIDNSGNEARKFFRYVKTNIDDAWTLKDVWTTRRHEQRIELVEENVRIVKLVFPPNISKMWDVNAYNTRERLMARYNPDLLHTPRIISDFVLDSTIHVDEQDFFSLVDHRRKYEVYAKNIGLVYKMYKDNAISNFDTLQIRIGREIHYRMIDFGVE